MYLHSNVRTHAYLWVKKHSFQELLSFAWRAWFSHFSVVGEFGSCLFRRSAKLVRCNQGSMYLYPRSILLIRSTWRREHTCHWSLGVSPFKSENLGEQAWSQQSAIMGSFEIVVDNVPVYPIKKEALTLTVTSTRSRCGVWGKETRLMQWLKWVEK